MTTPAPLPHAAPHGARKVVSANQKGGSGKTTTLANIGKWFSLQGYRVLFIDGDPNATLSRNFLDEDVNARQFTIAELIGMGLETPPPGPDLNFDLDIESDPEPLPTQDAIVAIEPNLHLLPSNKRLAPYDVTISQTGGQSILREILAPVQDNYDLIFIDTVPFLSTLQIIGLRAADEVLIPITPTHFDTWGLSELVGSIRQVKKDNRALLLRGMVLNRVQARTSLYQEIVGTLQRTPIPILGSIRQATSIARAPGLRQTIFEYDPNSSAAEDYRQLGRTLIERWAAPAAPQAREVSHAR